MIGMNQLNQRIYMSSPHIGEYEQGYVAEAFATNWVAPLGPNVDAFENELAGYVSVKGAVALSSGTAAIHLALRLLGVGQGDTVICSTLTFVASANPILYQGARPVFIDSELESWNMSPTALERACSDLCKEGKRPKAAIVVNLYGQSADMDPILEICDRYGIPVVEDAAESLGASYRGKASGTFGKFGVYSFNGNKIITTSGGGALVSDDANALQKARFWATQARDSARHYQHSEMGYNYRMSNILAGVGRGQLRVLDDRVAARRRVFDRYKSHFAETKGIEFMPEAVYGRATRWLTAMTIDSRRTGITSVEMVDYLAEKNIESRPVWKPLHLQPMFEEASYYPHSEIESISDMLFTNGICLPSGSNLADSDIDRVLQAMDELLKK